MHLNEVCIVALLICKKNLCSSKLQLSSSVTQFLEFNKPFVSGSYTRTATNTTHIMAREFIEGWDLLQILVSGAGNEEKQFLFRYSYSSYDIHSVPFDVELQGEGTFGEVKLLVNRATGEACAMKEIDLGPHNGDPATRDAVQKEICVHKLLK